MLFASIDKIFCTFAIYWNKKERLGFFATQDPTFTDFFQDIDQVIFGGLLSEPPKVTDSFCGENHFSLLIFFTTKITLETKFFDVAMNNFSRCSSSTVTNDWVINEMKF